MQVNGNDILSGDIDDNGSGIGTLRIDGGKLNTANLGDVTLDVFDFRGQDGDATLVWDKGTEFRVKDEFKIGDASGRTATFDLRSGNLDVDGDITSTGAGTAMPT